MTTVFINGRFYGTQDGPPISEAKVAAFDAGLQHSVGLFETMLGGVSRRGIEGPVSHGEEVEAWVMHLDEHLERLAGSARQLGLSDQLRTEALAEAVLATVRESDLGRARIRLTITGGDLAMLAAAQGGSGGGEKRAVDPTVMIVAQPATAYPEAMFQRGVMAALAESRANPLNAYEGHKTLNYWWRLRELQAAAAKGAGEALVLSVTNHVCGGCVSNVFVVKGESVATPIARGQERESAGGAAQGGGKGPAVVPSAVLPGVTRAWVMDRAERLGLRVEARMLSVQDVVDADEVFLTNSSWGILPVVRLEGSEIGGGAPGRVALDLRDAWMEMIPAEPEE